MKPRAKCNVEDCDKDSFPGKRGMCVAHYRRWYRHGDPLAGNNSPGTKLLFAEKAMQRETDSCINWPFSKKGEYGNLNYKGDIIGAHVYVCTKIHGNKPSEKHRVRQTCRNKSCINWRHLVWSAKRLPAKSKPEASNTKITKVEVYKIRSAYDRGINCRRIAEKYGITSTQVIRIGKRTAWSNLSEKE